jgi:dTDP-glucose 4,6-dehydratase
MPNNLFSEIRQDCLNACQSQPELRNALALKHIAVTGGTGFLGSWLAEMVAALNDEYHLGITLDLYARGVKEWARRYPHLSKRRDIGLKMQDVRSQFEFARNTQLVVHAAGIPNSRVHASDPLRVQQTTVQGLDNALQAASQLDNLVRFLNVSSCLVNGRPQRPGPLDEVSYFAVPCGQLHTVYVEAKRAAENLGAIYRSQFRMPVSTIRPFTFAGPYQELDRPWAINNFLRDVLTGGDIRIHGDGSARRSYLYGSDAACWTLAALAHGVDGATYNIGSPEPISHLALAREISQRLSSRSRVTLNTAPNQHRPLDDLFPDLAHTQKALGVQLTCSLQDTIDKSWRWYESLRQDNSAR